MEVPSVVIHAVGTLSRREKLRTVLRAPFWGQVQALLRCAEKRVQARLPFAALKPVLIFRFPGHSLKQG